MCKLIPDEKNSLDIIVIYNHITLDLLLVKVLFIENYLDLFNPINFYNLNLFYIKFNDQFKSIPKLNDYYFQQHQHLNLFSGIIFGFLV